VVLAVNVGDVATPEALVVAWDELAPLKVPLGPEPGAENVTTTPGIRFPAESLTVAVRTVGKALLMFAVWGVPPVAAMEDGGPGVTVRRKAAWPAAPGAEADTVKVPVVALAVKAADVATPAAVVTAEFVPPAKLPLAPEAGATKVTVMPLNRLLKASRTVTTSGEPKV
jgi:hypothetical protein